MTADHFALTSLETGRLVGHALVCVEARYCSVRWRSASRLDRRFVDAAGWRAMIHELEVRGWPDGLVPGRSGLGVALIDQDRRGLVAMQYVASPPIPGDGPAATAALDAYLRAQLLP